MSARLRRVFSALLVGATCVPAVSAQTGPGVWNELVRIVTAEPRKDAADVSLFREIAAELAIVSPTFRQMLDALKAAPHMTVRARPLSVRSALGRGRFLAPEAVVLREYCGRAAPVGQLSSLAATYQLPHTVAKGPFRRARPPPCAPNCPKLCGSVIRNVIESIRGLRAPVLGPCAGGPV